MGNVALSGIVSRIDCNRITNRLEMSTDLSITIYTGRMQIRLSVSRPRLADRLRTSADYLNSATTKEIKNNTSKN